MSRVETRFLSLAEVDAVERALKNNMVCAVVLVLPPVPTVRDEPVVAAFAVDAIQEESVDGLELRIAALRALAHELGLSEMVVTQ